MFNSLHNSFDTLSNCSLKAKGGTYAVCVCVCVGAPQSNQTCVPTTAQDAGGFFCFNLFYFSLQRQTIRWKLTKKVLPKKYILEQKISFTFEV